MTKQFTKFTNLPIHNVEGYTAITKTKIEDIPMGITYDTMGRIVSMREHQDYYYLYTIINNSDGSIIEVREEENHDWLVSYISPGKQTVINERSNSDWDKYKLATSDAGETRLAIEEHYGGEDHKQFIEHNRCAYFNPDQNTYSFDVALFASDVAVSVNEWAGDLSVVEKRESICFVGEKEQVLIAIDKIVADLLNVKRSIEDHASK